MFIVMVIQSGAAARVLYMCAWLMPKFIRPINNKMNGFTSTILVILKYDFYYIFVCAYRRIMAQIKYHIVIDFYMLYKHMGGIWNRTYKKEEKIKQKTYNKIKKNMNMFFDGIYLVVHEPCNGRTREVSKTTIISKI